MVCKRVSIVLVLSLLVGCAPASGQAEVEDLYRAENGVFSCPLPALAEPGARTDEVFLDAAFMVVFTDDFGHLYRIEGEKVESPVPEGATALEVALGNIFEGLVMAGFKIVAPEATVVESASFPDQRGGAFFAVVSLPGASSLSMTKNGGPVERLDALRSSFLFFEAGWFFIVSVQLPPTIGNDEPLHLEESARRLKTMTLDFVESIQVHGGEGT